MARLELYRGFNIMDPPSYVYEDISRTASNTFDFQMEGDVVATMKIWNRTWIEEIGLRDAGGSVLKLFDADFELTYWLGQTPSGDILKLVRYGLTGDDVLVGSKDADVMAGYEGSDRLDGFSGNDYLKGFEGSDTMVGGAGNDSLFGGDDNDSFIVDAGSDRLVGGGGIDLLRLTGAVGGGVDLAASGVQRFANYAVQLMEIESINGTVAADRLYGNSEGNTLTGLGGNDLLSGRVGSDRLVGGAGNDQISGGPQADRFVFGNGDGVDVVTDFSDRSDRIEFTSGANRYSDLRISQVGDDVHIRYDNGLVKLQDVDLKLISAEDFIFS